MYINLRTNCREVIDTVIAERIASGKRLPMTLDKEEDGFYRLIIDTEPED
jgi:hypothetical protein